MQVSGGLRILHIGISKDFGLVWLRMEEQSNSQTNASQERNEATKSEENLLMQNALLNVSGTYSLDGRSGSVETMEGKGRCS